MFLIYRALTASCFRLGDPFDHSSGVTSCVEDTDILVPDVLAPDVFVCNLLNKIFKVVYILCFETSKIEKHPVGGRTIRTRRFGTGRFG